LQERRGLEGQRLAEALVVQLVVRDSEQDR
jgi:hypothetical protein